MRTAAVATAAAATRTFGNTRTHRSLAPVYVLLGLNALDVLTTHIGLQMGAVEANPVVSGLMGGLGESSAYLIKLSVVLIAALLIWKFGKLGALKWLNLAMAGIVTSNLIIFVQGIIG